LELEQELNSHKIEFASFLRSKSCMSSKLVEKAELSEILHDMETTPEFFPVLFILEEMRRAAQLSPARHECTLFYESVVQAFAKYHTENGNTHYTKWVSDGRMSIVTPITFNTCHDYRAYLYNPTNYMRNLNNCAGDTDDYSLYSYKDVSFLDDF
jgi:hypothetical protein